MNAHSYMYLARNGWHIDKHNHFLWFRWGFKLYRDSNHGGCRIGPFTVKEALAIQRFLDIEIDKRKISEYESS